MGGEDEAMLDAKTDLWDAFCSAHSIIETGVPLFRTDTDGSVSRDCFGKDKRQVLARSREMEELLVSVVESVLDDPAKGGLDLEGVLYLMHWRENRRILPLYIGRAGKYGRSDGKISANLDNIRSNKGFFARWGSNYAYHIGDLSAVVCCGHPAQKVTPKYQRWAARLFRAWPADKPLLIRPVYFWATPWGPQSRSIWREYGSSSLAFQEYLLIGVASDLFPEVLLNDEGVNRAGPLLTPTQAEE
jgi:hypothetical protein